MQTRAEIKYLIDIKNLYALYTFHVEENFVEKTQLKTHQIKTYLFETMFQSKKAKKEPCNANQLTGFYAILNIDRNGINSMFFLNSIYDNLMQIIIRNVEGKSFRKLIFEHF